MQKKCYQIAALGKFLVGLYVSHIRVSHLVAMAPCLKIVAPTNNTAFLVGKTPVTSISYTGICERLHRLALGIAPRGCLGRLSQRYKRANFLQVDPSFFHITQLLSIPRRSVYLTQTTTF